MIILTAIIFGFSLFYLKYLESNYNSLINQAYKRKNEFPQFVNFEGEIEPSIPNTEINSKDHPGLDTDNNGIRDDIDIWINRMGVSANERLALRQYARALQIVQKKCQGNISHDLTDSENLAQAKRCLSMISDYEREEKGQALKMLNILIANTDLRKTCYTDGKNIEKDTVVSIDLLKENCKFEVHDPESIIEVHQILKASQPVK